MDLLKQNGKLLEAGKKDKVEVNALKKEFGKVKKSIEDSRLRLVDLEDLHRKMDELKDIVEGLDTQVGELTTKVVEAKEISIAKF